MVSMASAMIAPARLTNDSSASESKPTEPVKKYAAAFNRIVKSAAAMESHAKRVREARFVINDVILNLYGSSCGKFALPPNDFTFIVFDRHVDYVVQSTINNFAPLSVWERCGLASFAT